MSEAGDSGVVLIVGVREASARAEASPLENRLVVAIDKVHNFL
jgi:hypothetical protein